MWNSAGWVATTLIQLPLKLIPHWLHWTLCSWCFISFIINNDRNVLIERKMMFMIFTNILLRTIWISFPSLWTPWDDTAKGSVLPRASHTPGLKIFQLTNQNPTTASKAPREPLLGAECLANSSNSLKILIILCVVPTVGLAV